MDDLHGVPDMGKEDPIPAFSYLVKQLKERYPNLAYVHVASPNAPFCVGPEDESVSVPMRCGRLKYTDRRNRQRSSYTRSGLHVRSSLLAVIREKPASGRRRKRGNSLAMAGTSWQT